MSAEHLLALRLVGIEQFVWLRDAPAAGAGSVAA